MFKKVFIVSSLAIIIALYFGENSRAIISYIFDIILFTNTTSLSSNFKQEKLFRKEELQLYDGAKKPEIYLAILGQVYDVTRGAKHYGPKKQYSVFVGCDASRSFVTGKFDEADKSDEVVDFDHQQLRSLNHWINFYAKDYKKIGKLIGKYYDENGKPTAYAKAVQKLIEEAELAKENEDLEKIRFPPCNVEWNADMGSRVWCSERSGGIVRGWIGVPRQLYEPGSKSYRCACISEHNEKLGNLKEYEGCTRNSPSCFVKQ